MKIKDLVPEGTFEKIKKRIEIEESYKKAKRRKVGKK